MIHCRFASNLPCQLLNGNWLPRLVVAGLLWASASTNLQGQLRIDFNDRSNDLPLYTLEDFDAFVINAAGSSTAIQTNSRTLRFGRVDVSIWDTFGTGHDDRKRTTPINNGAFTQAELLQDSIFATSTTANSGLSVRLDGLASNQVHSVTLWSFDSGSAGNRVSDWYANGVLVRSNYSFNGAVLPAANDTYRFSFTATSSASGQILIEGRRAATSVDQNGAPAAGVFLNALEVSPIPQQGPPCGTANHFKAGVNLYGWTGGATFAEQDQEVAMLKEAGVYRVRINVVWFAVEPSQKGSYDESLLALYDHLMQRLAENGIKVVFVTADTPYWASADPQKFTDATGQHWDSRYRPANYNDFADYMVFLLNRYRSTGPHAFEIWNEQDAKYFWPSGPSAGDYVNMLRAAYAAIKLADTNATVLNGGLTDSGSFSNYAVALYAAGAKPCFDAWSQHIYRRTPQYETAVQTMRDIMVANGDGAKKIWITETGWPTYTNTPTDPSAVSFQRQARYLTNLFTRLAAYPYVEEGLWYTSRSYDETVKEGSFGLALPDFRHKPSFYAFSNWVVNASAICVPSGLRFKGVTMLDGGIAHLEFFAPTGFAYGIQYSSDLQSWVGLPAPISSSNGFYTVEDTNAPTASLRSYRITWEPPQ